MSLMQQLVAFSFGREETGNPRPGSVGGAVEDEVHALFDCTFSPHLVLLRSQFLALLASCDPDISAQHAAITNYAFLLKLVGSRKAVKLFAKYVYEDFWLIQCPSTKSIREMTIYYQVGTSAVIHPPPPPPPRYSLSVESGNLIIAN
ncbi:hypothetical protein C8J57DRAFT_1258723 [Mycena rebaudengoi]|nr:hypothetical protein C8J57DRAFT_1258723 [Mycena rebaudengoi]